MPHEILTVKNDIFNYIFNISTKSDLIDVTFVQNYDIRDYESILKTMTHSNVAINLVGRNFPTR